MRVEDPNPESAPEGRAEHVPASLPRRLAALFALVALLAAAAISSWWIVTDRADFGATAAGRAPAAADGPGSGS